MAVGGGGWWCDWGWAERAGAVHPRRSLRASGSPRRRRRESGSRRRRWPRARSRGRGARRAAPRTRRSPRCARGRGSRRHQGRCCRWRPWPGGSRGSPAARSRECGVAAGLGTGCGVRSGSERSEEWVTGVVSGKEAPPQWPEGKDAGGKLAASWRYSPPQQRPSRLAPRRPASRHPGCRLFPKQCGRTKGVLTCP